jgi:hypothetical protein
VAFAISQSTALVLLFVVLPIVLAPIVVAFVAWRAPAPPPGTRTSELLSDGEAATAELVGWRDKGAFLELRPMVAFELIVAGEAPFELTVVQSVPRRLLSRLERGMTLDVRLSPDRAAGAIVFDRDS